MVNRHDAVNEVMEHTSTSVNYHKIVLSPSDEEPVNDWREWTCQIMHDLALFIDQLVSAIAYRHPGCIHCKNV